MADGQTPTDGAPPVDGTTPDAAPTRPEHIPEKFWDAEAGKPNVDALGKAYGELERKQSAAAPKPETAAGALGLPVDVPDPIDDNAGVDELITSAGLDPNEVARNFLDNGKLTTEQYAALKKKGGFTRGVVDQHMKLQIQLYQAAQEKLVAEASKMVGGDDQRKTVLNWAGQNLNPTDRKFYDGMASNPETSIQGFEWLVGKYNAAVGSGGAQPLISGDGTTPAAGGAFASQADMLKATNDRRYLVDKSYTAAVQARLGATDIRVIEGRQ